MLVRRSGYCEWITLSTNVEELQLKGLKIIISVPTIDRGTEHFAIPIKKVRGHTIKKNRICRVLLFYGFG